MSRKCKPNLWLPALVVVCLVFVAITPNAADQTYNVIEISAGGDEVSIATGMNNSGDVIGTSTDKKGRSSAFFWRNGRIIRINDLGKKHTFVTGINDVGQVVGYFIPNKGPLRAFILDTNRGELTELPTPPGAVSLTSRINNSGQVVGRSHNAEGHSHEEGERAFKYDNGQVTDLHSSLNLDSLGAERSDAIGINNSGRVIGHFYTAVHIGYSHGYFHRQGEKPIDIGTLGGRNTVVTGINDANQVSGYSQISNGEPRAFVWDRIHGMLTIHPFPGGTQSLAYDINNLGQVVGASDSGEKRLQAFLYSGGKMRNLNRLIPAGSGWELVIAKAINDKGQIAGEGLIRGERRAFLLTPRS